MIPTRLNNIVMSPAFLAVWSVTVVRNIYLLDIDVCSIQCLFWHLLAGHCSIQSLLDNCFERYRRLVHFYCSLLKLSSAEVMYLTAAKLNTALHQFNLI
jgi:hypothetical protein